MAERIPVDFGDLLIGLADNLDDIRVCIVCGADSTRTGLWVDDDATVGVSAWCDEAVCENDRLLTKHVLAFPIEHLAALRDIEHLIAAKNDACTCEPDAFAANQWWHFPGCPRAVLDRAMLDRLPKPPTE